jgi:hypothetical protein
MIIRDLSSEAVDQMVRVDLTTVNEEPPSPIDPFQFHDCTVGVGSFSGRPPWELHTHGDELLHILAGESELTMLEDGRPVTRWQFSCPARRGSYEHRSSDRARQPSPHRQSRS